ncbi:MAG: hypothetical protein ABI818_05090 [Acidobacteriota bacterium]
MEAGIVVDHTYGAYLEPQWVEGPVETSFWTGLKLRGKEKHKVRTYRCPSCGYLESYA